MTDPILPTGEAPTSYTSSPAGQPIGTTENSGSSTGTGAQQTIAHGLAATPTRVFLSESTTGGALAYQSATADSTNIYITATNAKTYQWEAKVV